MLKLGIAALLGAGGFAAGYYFHQLMLAPADCVT
jgi:hypothetical protein